MVVFKFSSLDASQFCIQIYSYLAKWILFEEKIYFHIPEGKATELLWTTVIRSHQIIFSGGHALTAFKTHKTLIFSTSISKLNGAHCQEFKLIVLSYEFFFRIQIRPPTSSRHSKKILLNQGFVCLYNIPTSAWVMKVLVRAVHSADL